MNKRRGIVLILLFILTACATPPTPTSVPTASVPPTAVPSPIPLPTATVDVGAVSRMILQVEGDITRVHDPAMIKAEGKYYIFSTGPGIAMRCSPDMQVWKFCGQVFGAVPKWVREKVPQVGDLWAPDITLHNGKYYLYYAASSFGSNNSVIGVATNVTLDNASPNYKWVDEGEVYGSQPTNNYNAIDPNLAFDANGTPWLSFGSFWSGIKMVQLDETLTRPIADAKLYNLATDTGNTAIEAAFIVRRGEYYYLFVSYDFCCKGAESNYNMRVGRSKEITGPYVDRDGTPMTEGGGTMVFDGSARWHGPGHNSILIEGDKYWLVYHAYDAQFGGVPTLHVEALQWDEDGWFVAPSALLEK